MEQPHHRPSVVKRTLNALAWVLIALLLAATLWTVLWAAKQPKVHSIWGEPSEKPADPEFRPDAQWVTPHAIDLQIFKDKMTRIGINGFGRMGRLALPRRLGLPGCINRSCERNQGRCGDGGTPSGIRQCSRALDPEYNGR